MLCVRVLQLLTYLSFIGRSVAITPNTLHISEFLYFNYFNFLASFVQQWHEMKYSTTQGSPRHCARSLRAVAEGPEPETVRHTSLLSIARHSPTAQRWQNRCRHCSPTDALIDLIFRCHLGLFIPIWLNVDTIAHLRVAPVPQRRPACWCDARWLCLQPNLIQYLADVGAVGDEGDDAHLPATDGAYKR